MKTSSSNPNPGTVITLTIEGDLYLLPASKNINEVLECLAGIRKVRDEHFWNLNPVRRVLIDRGEADISISSSKREVVTEDRAQEIKKEDSEARKVAEEKADAERKAREEAAK